MSNVWLLVITVALYVICIRASFARLLQPNRARFFAAGNIITLIWITLLTQYDEWFDRTILSLGTEAVIRHIGFVGAYVAIVAAGFIPLRRYARREGWLPWAAFFYPILMLIVIGYCHSWWRPILERLGWEDWVVTTTFVGISYMGFRLSYLVLEVRNAAAEMPTLSEYLGFAFFLPTMLVGPINPFSVHQRSIQNLNETKIPFGRCLLRILVGATKYIFLANLANQLTYTGIFLDGKPHAPIDLIVAMVFFYLYLYCNFSGFCDMAIGVAGLVGIRVKENFDNPFAARNIKDFWNRWHITLSQYTRDVIFAPLSKLLIRKLGVAQTNQAIAASILAVFVVIGVWHGVGWRFAIFGLIHAFGVIANHFYTIWLKRTLGKEGFKNYNNNRVIHAAAVVLTFFYVAASFAFFANDYEMMGIIRNALRDGLQLS